MKKITFATLKTFVKRGTLRHKINKSFDGMVDGFTKWESNEKHIKTTIDDLSLFRCHKNHLYLLDNGTINLSNCCYDINFIIN